LELAPALHRAFEPLNIGIARATEWLLLQLGIPVSRSDAVLAHPDGFSYRITYVCSGLRPIAIIAVTLLIVPVSRGWRLTGLALGVMGVEALNLCRLVHLYWLGVVDPDAFFTAHRVTWNIVAIVMVAGFLLLWLRGSRRHEEEHGLSTTAHAHT
jgi:exosortase/archaeosortase family protein